MSDQFLFTIATSFISLLLIVNAYFTRETLLRVVKIEVKLENNSTRQNYIERQSNDNTYELKKIRGRLHTLEGSQASLLKFLEEIEKKG